MTQKGRVGYIYILYIYLVHSSQVAGGESKKSSAIPFDQQGSIANRRIKLLAIDRLRSLPNPNLFQFIGTSLLIRSWEDTLVHVGVARKSTEKKNRNERRMDNVGFSKKKQDDKKDSS